MKKNLKMLLALAALSFTSCTRTVNENAELITNVSQKPIPEEILNTPMDSTSFNKNVVVSSDSKIAYVMVQGETGPQLVHTIECEGESEEPSFAIFIMAVIIIIILFG
jgi:hypothetical protein